MQLGPGRFLFLLGGCIAALTSAALFSARASADLRAKANAVHAQESTLRDLRAERDALVARQPPTDALEQAIRDQAVVDSERAAVVELRAVYQRAVLEAMRPISSRAAPPRELPNRTTPEAALQSVIRAIADGEAEELASLIDFESSARQQAEQFFSSLSADLRTEYGSPDRLVAHVMTAKTNHLIGIAAVDQLVLVDSDHASLRVKLERPEGRFRTANFQLRRNSDGWRLHVPAKVIEGYRALVTGRWDGSGRSDAERNAAATSWPSTTAAPDAAP